MTKTQRMINKLDDVYNGTPQCLMYKTASPMDREDAITVMEAALPYGYNSFTAKLLKHLPEDAQINLAREYSVCIYFTTNQPIDMKKLMKLMKADEFSKTETGEYRVWWD